MLNKKTIMMLSLVALVLIPVVAMAVNQPANGDPFYDVYDIVVNKFLKGPVGFVTAVIAMISGFALGFRQQFIPGIVSVALGVIMIKADSLVTSLGALF